MSLSFVDTHVHFWDNARIPHPWLVEVPDIAGAHTPTELTRLAQSPLRLNQWVCLEWQIHVGTQGAIRVWVDDVEDPDLYIPADTSLVAPDSGEGTVVVAGLGFFTDQAVTFSSYDVWFDDIAVSPQRIGCH